MPALNDLTPAHLNMLTPEQIELLPLLQAEASGGASGRVQVVAGDRIAATFTTGHPATDFAANDYLVLLLRIRDGQITPLVAPFSVLQQHSKELVLSIDVAADDWQPGDVGVVQLVLGDATAFRMFDVLAARATEAHLDELSADIDTLLARTAGGVSISPGSHIAEDGVTLVLVQGETYLLAINNPIRLDVADARLPATIASNGTVPVLHITPHGRTSATLTLTGELVSFDAETGQATVRFEMTRAQSAELNAGANNRWELDWRIANDAEQILTSVIDAPCHVRRQIG